MDQPKVPRLHATVQYKREGQKRNKEKKKGPYREKRKPRREGQVK